MLMEELETWIKKRIASIDGDLALTKRCKKEGRTPPFAEDNEQWVEQIKNRKDAFEEVLAHIECEKLNKAIHLHEALKP